jgi:acetoacetyl-CoA synthetase
MSEKILWQPDPATIELANLTRYIEWLNLRHYKGGPFENYDQLWAWSVEHPELFWKSVWDFFDISSQSTYHSIMQGDMPYTKWFEGATLNYAAHIFRSYSMERPAMLFASERHDLQAISWDELRRQTSLLAAHLRQCGVKTGDRVVGYLPNIPAATVAFLATASIGAVWSSASPDFGAASVVERFGQIEPVVLIAVNGYSYGGKIFDKTAVVAELQAQIPSLRQTILIEYIEASATSTLLRDVQSYETLIAPEKAELLTFTAVLFDHPLWVLYSSGTTGKPKAITHSQGGMLLEHYKYGAFHNDVQAGERFFWYTTTGWMMWNYLNAMLLAGATIVLYDGSPAWPDMNRLWQLAEATRVHHFGISAAFILACMKAEISPKQFNLRNLRSIGATGSPLPSEGFDWIYEQVKSDVWLTSMSGGTDVCTAFVGGNPLLPVYEGEIQCRALGCALVAFDEQGQAVTDTVGEMVITQPMPCMPIKFWNDPDGSQYFNSYFDTYEGVWRHGDWVRITERQTVVIYGRSDATLNRQGIRIGTSEIYRSVEQIEAIRDSLIINIERDNGDSWMPLFVVLRDGVVLDDALKQAIARQLRSDYSPRHVPDIIIEVPDIPYTISGKKLELPVKRLLIGKPLAQAANLGSVRNPDALVWFEQWHATQQ